MLSRVWRVWVSSWRFRPRVLPLVPSLALVIGSVLLACSGTAITETCGVVGRERSCDCTGRSIGIQACQFDGTWEACTCFSVSGGSGGAGAGAAAGTAGTGDTGGRGGDGGTSAPAEGRASTGGSRSFGFPFPTAGRTPRRD